MIFADVKNAVRRVVDFPRRCCRRKVWNGIRRPDGESAVLGFGGVIEPGRFVHGGAVKLLTLRDAFASDERAFNILCMVSSAQPEFAGDLAAVCRGKGIKFVWNQNGVGYPGWAGGEAEFHNAPMRRLRAEADFVVYQSAFCRISAGKFLGPCETGSATLFNPVDLQEFRPREDELSPSPLRLLAMGTQNYRERVAAVIECVRVLRAEGLECTLTVAGPLLWKNAAADLRSAIAEAGLTGCVVIRPPFSHVEAAAIYRGHHILVHPKYLDPCPTVVAEALACGLPVVASRSGGIPEMTDPECAELIDVPLVWDRLVTPTGAQLAVAVRKIHARLGSASQAARRRAECAFDAGVWVERHREIFQRLLA